MRAGSRSSRIDKISMSSRSSVDCAERDDAADGELTTVERVGGAHGKCRAHNFYYKEIDRKSQIFDS
jgi:hypothetical protein